MLQRSFIFTWLHVSDQKFMLFLQGSEWAALSGGSRWWGDGRCPQEEEESGLYPLAKIFCVLFVIRPAVSDFRKN